ncbi:hypothetical protein BDZ94DRAFT_1318390 [Collybia nuda]|uniref:Uncharacterized protein n=1 Tax=Collybia nuda TaxID=64659 RepID=A0A9P6CIN7_9AGAR|nr:hypothetical protein BDZ94DRAFT_1318390 [Collybia nuda]
MVPSLFAPERPTLPPLHTLDLPNPTSMKPRLHGAQLRHEFYDQYPRYNIRQVSDSSSSTSRTSSPTPSISPMSGAHALPSLPSNRRQTVLFYPCSLEEADAALLIPPPSAPYVPRVSDLGTSSPFQQKQNKCLLLTGPRLDELRRPGRQLAKGARIHPYRLAMRGNTTRRLSESSMQSDE